MGCIRFVFPKIHADAWPWEVELSGWNLDQSRALRCQYLDGTSSVTRGLNGYKENLLSFILPVTCFPFSLYQEMK